MDYDFDEVDTLYGCRLVGSSRLPEKSCQLVIDSNFTSVSGFQFPSHFGWQDGTNYQVGFSAPVSRWIERGGKRGWISGENNGRLPSNQICKVSSLSSFLPKPIAMKLESWRGDLSGDFFIYIFGIIMLSIILIIIKFF
jgi:hypothetical protein